LRRAAALGLGSIALALGASSYAEASPQPYKHLRAGSLLRKNADPMQTIGVVDATAWWSDNPQEIAFTVNLAHSMGYNAFKTIVPVVQGISPSAEALNDQRSCYVAQAAAANNMDDYIDLVAQNSDGTLAPMPSTPDQINAFAGQAEDYLTVIAQCAPSKTVNMELDNEPNYYYSSPNTAMDYAKLMSFSYNALEAKAQALGIPIKDIGLELTTSQDPLGFLQKLKQAERALKIKGPLMDTAAFHPYDNGDVSASQMDSTIIPAIQQTVGPVNVIDTEYATGQPTDNLKAAAYVHAISTAACQGVKVFFNFELYDDQPSAKNGWHSAPYMNLPTPQTDSNQNVVWPPSPNWTPVAKPIILAAQESIIAKALSGNIPCPPQP